MGKEDKKRGAGEKGGGSSMKAKEVVKAKQHLIIKMHFKKLIEEMNASKKIYVVINHPGHGKCDVDAIGSQDKTRMVSRRPWRASISRR